ncbi:MAG: hypothetical protein ACKOBH_04095 [bacterium]
MSSDTAALVTRAVERFQVEVPALAELKLVFALELKGRGDLQVFRVEVPGPKVSKEQPDDARVSVTVGRAEFNDLAEKGTVESYRTAWETGEIKASGDPNIQKLIGQIVARQIERSRLKKSH